MRVSYSPGYVADIPDDHIFPMKKFSGLYTYLTEKEIIKPNEVIEPSMVEMSNLVTAHTTGYAFSIWNGSLTKKEERRMGLPWSKSLAVRSRLALSLNGLRNRIVLL